MNGSSQDFDHDLERSLERVWALIELGACESDSAAHTPVVATTGSDGAPAQRVMVLRHCDRAQHRLRFHTDSRAGKVAEIARNASCAVLVYDAAAKIQLRLEGTARTETDGPLADAAWHDAGNYARRCYLADPSPGTVTHRPTSGLPPSMEGERPSDRQLVPARFNFAVMLVDIDRIDFLHLAHEGHRRARFSLVDDSWQGRWLVP